MGLSRLLFVATLGRNWKWRGLAVAAGLVWVAVLLASSLRKSATVDEVPHIASGLAALHYRDYRMNPEHPPLVKVLATLPAYLFYRPDMRVDLGGRYVGAWADGDQNRYGYYLLHLAGKEPLALLLACRVVPVLIGLLGGVVVWALGRRMSRSAWGGAAAAAMLMLYPEYAGHTRYITMDVPAVVGCAAVSWASLRWWRRPGGRSAAVLAAVAAVGSQVKMPVTVFTMFVLATLLLVIAVRGMRQRGSEATRRRAIGFVPMALGVAVAIYAACWAGAGFRFSYLPPGATPPAHTTFIPPLQGGGGALARVVNLLWEHRLLPETTLATLAIVSSFAAREMFLFGEMSLTGWYHYFFVTIVAKTSVLYLLGVAGAVATVGVGLRRMAAARRWHDVERWVLFGLPFALLFALFVVSRTNIGHRHVLFVYVPLAVLLGTAVVRWWRCGGAGPLLSGGLVASQLLVFGLGFPHYESYFNELVRSPYRGHYILGDSNVDWGQDLPLASEYLDEVGEKRCNFAAMGFNRPESYGIRQFNWILPGYPFSINMPPAVSPDPTLPSVISLNGLPAVRQMYPELYRREPDVLLNSMVVYLPRALRANSEF